jgi:TusA-related sulfurtransferase
MRQAIPLGLVLTTILFMAAAAWAADEPATASEPAKQKADASVGSVAPGKGDAAADAAFTERLKQVRLIEIKYLRTTDEKQFQQGRQKLLEIKDEACIGPMVQVLYTDNARYRGLLLEVLGEWAGHGSKVAQAYLQEVAVGDANASNRKRAVENLKTWTGDPPTKRIMAHLALDEVPVFRDRAATALAALAEKKAVWLLVERLVTTERRVVGAEINNMQVVMDIRGQSCGVPTFRHATISAAVPGGSIATATIDLPEVQVIDFKTTIAMPDRHVTADVQMVQIQHPEVLAALKQLTGKDFGYSQAAWQQWLQSAEASKVVPPWEPIRLGGE